MHSLNIHSCENRIQASVKSANSLRLPASNLQIIWGCQKSTFKGWALNLYRGSRNVPNVPLICTEGLPLQAHWSFHTLDGKLQRNQPFICNCTDLGSVLLNNPFRILHQCIPHVNDPSRWFAQTGVFCFSADPLWLTCADIPILLQ